MSFGIHEVTKFYISFGNFTSEIEISENITRKVYWLEKSNMINLLSDNTRKVENIKIIRALFGWTLRESKEYVDLLVQGHRLYDSLRYHFTITDE